MKERIRHIIREASNNRTILLYQKFIKHLIQTAFQFKVEVWEHSKDGPGNDTSDLEDCRTVKAKPVKIMLVRALSPQE